MLNFGSLFYLILKGFCLLAARGISLNHSKDDPRAVYWRHKADRCEAWLQWMEGAGPYPNKESA